MKKTISLVLVLALGLAAEVANADFTFGEPTNLGPMVNSSSGDIPYSFSSDGLEMYLTSYNRPGGYGGYDIWVTRRATKDDAWGIPENLGPVVNSSAWDWAPWISPDGLELYFASRRPGGYGSDDIWVSRRATNNDPWGSPVNLGAVLNSFASESFPFLSSNGLLLFFSEDIQSPLRPGGFGNSDMWVTTRASVNDPWGTPVNLGPMVNTSSYDGGPRISPDGSMLYFCSERPGGFGGPYGDIYQASIIPIVDLNGDGVVDAADMCIMVEHWEMDEPLCDIGPTPLGDGIVDVQDLIVLAKYFFVELNDSTLVAHWSLDEAEGDIAQDSANENEGSVHGDPTWQPEGGMVDGALQLDGIDDYVNTPFVLNPADGKFSVLAWIKGGSPGQAVLSQMDGARWLCADPSEGNLMTELKGTGRDAAELLSQTIITDGDWHRIALVWDGTNRTLYVDDVAVAEDTQTNLVGSENGLYIGAGKAMEPGSFWSGLIDDVRIYNRVVTP
ncbi:MAG: LamG-like jellyroll fold domain-containing protein [Pseudomonadota bacterium]